METVELIKRTLKAVIQEYCRRAAVDAHSRRDWMSKKLNQLAGEVKELGPAVKEEGRDRRPDNCEYPWETEEGGNWIAPVDHTFPNLDVFSGASLPSDRTKAGAEFTRLVQFALQTLNEQIESSSSAN